jgi:3-oxoacyl-[acyl-carrier protein] reductase
MTEESQDRRVALVTGGGRGIGAGIVKRFCAQGIAVGVAELDAEPAEETAAAAREAGGEAIALPGDVTDAARVQEWVAELTDRYGNIDILVNNAGLTRDAMIHRMDRATWDLVQDVVLGGAFNTIQAVAPAFRDKHSTRARRIVNVASVSGIYGSIGNANYTAAKAGLIGLTRVISQEWARFGVTVNAVAPGFIATRMAAVRDEASGLGMSPEARAGIVARIPLGREGTPDDVAAAVEYFASESAGWVTGQVLEIHGGMPNITVTG